jgi:hypothetical protein
MGGFWPRIYVVKKHARGIYFLLQTHNFWHFSAPHPFSLYVLRYLLASAFHRLHWLLSRPHTELRSGRSDADLRSLRLV